jgi:hypothetical protein
MKIICNKKRKKKHTVESVFLKIKFLTGSKTLEIQKITNAGNIVGPHHLLLAAYHPWILDPARFKVWVPGLHWVIGSSTLIFNFFKSKRCYFSKKYKI